MGINLDRFVKNKPLRIGICGGAGQTQSLVQMANNIRNMGAIPHFMIDHGNYADHYSVINDARADLATVDAVVIMGNNADIDPASYGQEPLATTIHIENHDPIGFERQLYENAVIDIAREKKMPLVAICGGMQRVNISQLGTLHQHLPDLLGGSNHHEQPTAQEGAQLSGHGPLVVNGAYDIDPGSVIGQRMTVHQVKDICAHHQSIDKLGHGLRVSATHAVDRYRDEAGNERSLIEGIEVDPNGPLAGWPMVGFQFHPEFGASPILEPLIDWLGEEAAKYHARHPSPHARAAVGSASETGRATGLA